jgi:NAD(P)-dependent dehydrogenase (short-subunit alcohol dehydrogenase family)
VKTALVTGATRGIGRATAIALAKRGYAVAVTGRTQHEGDAAKRPEAEALPELKSVSGSLDSTVAAIEAEGATAVPIVLDLLDRDALAPAAERAIAELGHVDVVLNNAIYVGPAGEKRFLDTPAEELERRVFGNVTAQLLLAQPILRHMVERGSGVVAFTRIAEQLVVEHPEIRSYNLQPGAVATERVMAAGEKLEFVARHAAPVEVIGEAFARVLDAPAGMFANGSTIEVQDVARMWGLL